MVSGWHGIMLNVRCTSSGLWRITSVRKWKSSSEIEESQLVSLVPVKAFACFKKLVSLELPELQHYTPNHRSAFHGEGEDACASASLQNHLSSYLLIFIMAQRAHPSILWPCFRGHDSWRVHPEPHQSSNVFITATSRWHQFCLNPKWGGEKRIRWMEKEKANGRVGMNPESWYPLIYTSKGWGCLANFLKLICNVFRLSVALMCTTHGSCSLPHDQWGERVVTVQITVKRFWLVICRERTVWGMPFFFWASWGEVVRRIINCFFSARPVRSTSLHVKLKTLLSSVTFGPTKSEKQLVPRLLLGQQPAPLGESEFTSYLLCWTRG